MLEKKKYNPQQSDIPRRETPVCIKNLTKWCSQELIFYYLFLGNIIL